MMKDKRWRLKVEGWRFEAVRGFDDGWTDGQTDRQTDATENCVGMA